MIRGKLSAAAFLTLAAIAAASVTTAAHTANAQALTIEQRLSDFQQLNAIIDSSYGPLEYKKKRLNLDIAKIRAEYEQKIRAARTNGEFFYLLKQYVARYHDGHFNAQIPSGRVALFPVMMERVEGKAIIDTVVEGLPPELFPFKRGDEVVAVNGRPVEEEINELASYLGFGNPESEKRMATWLLFYRPGALVPIPESSMLSVTVKRHDSPNPPETVNVMWLIQGSVLDEDAAPKLASLGALGGLMRQPTVGWYHADYHKFSTKEAWDQFLQDRALALNLKSETAYSCSGGTRIKIPKDAVLVSQKPFVAYYHNTPYGKVGYLRVPHYMPQSPDGSPAIDEWFAMYEYAVSVFEQNTVGLIIDQDHNCGGFVNFANRFVGLFVDKPYKPMQFSLLASKGEYLRFNQWLSIIPRNTLMHSELLSVASAIKEAWLSEQPLTKPISLDGKQYLHPNPVRYSKPIVMLIDDMAGSGGDAVPAMLQGLGRAKLLGSQTASMGGHVEPQPPLNYSRVEVSLTKSLFFRPDGTPIENNGAVPDYPYTITHNDFMNGYQDYQAYYLKVLGELVAAQPSPALTLGAR